MPVLIPDSRLFRFLRTHVVECMTSIYVFYIIYTTLLPFDFSIAVQQPASNGRFLGLFLVTPNLPDVACNLALYFPLGILLRIALLKRRLAGTLTSFLAVLLISGCLSWGTEFIQQYSPSRVCSVADSVCNLLGAMAGAVMSSFFLAMGQAFVRVNRRNLVAQPSAVVAKVLAVVIALISLAPYDAAFTVNRMRDAAKLAIDSPFGRAGVLIRMARSEPEPMLRLAGLRDLWNNGLDYVAFMGLYAALFIVLMWYFRRHAGLSRLGSALWGWIHLSLMGLVLCFARLFIISLGFDASYFVACQIGIGLGLFMYSPIIQRWKPWVGTLSPEDLWSRKCLARSFVMIFCFWIVVRELVPFQFRFNTASLEDQLAASEWVPMQDYFLTKVPIAAADLMHKLTRFCGLGFCIALWQATPPLRQRQVGPGFGAVLVGLLLFALEGVQFLLPSRIPAVTDILLAVFGTWTGIEAYRLLVMYVFSLRQGAEGRILYNVELASPKPPVRKVSSKHAGRHS